MADSDNQRQAEDAHVYHHDEAGNRPAQGHHDAEVIGEQAVSSYWRANIRLLLGLLAVWFVTSFGFGILFVDELNKIPFFGFGMGFWWAQQGAIYVFIILIFVYAIAMKRIERRHGVDDDD